MSLATRYGLPKEGGIIQDDTLASRLFLELGILDKLQPPKDALPGRSTFQAIVDTTDDGFFVAALRFSGFDNQKDNGYGALVMSKRLCSLPDVIAKVQELARQMDATLTSYQPVIIDHRNN